LDLEETVKVKLAKQSKKRANTQKVFPWQRVTSETPEHEKEYIETLNVGLNQSQNIYELAAGLSGWLVQFYKLEKERTGTRIILPGERLN
jgi:hypothetical protein